MTHTHRISAHDVGRLTDAQAVSRVIVFMGIAESPRATWRVRTVARRLCAVYEDYRAQRMAPAEALAEAWDAVHPMAEQAGVA